MRLKFYTLSFLLLFINFFCEAQQADTRTNWFTEARFGMFIHWGLYSAAEGIWKGERLRDGNNYAEWIRYRNRIPENEYESLAKRFDWSKINPEQWVLLAKKAGAKYIIITAKHHDGIAIWDTRVSGYSLPKLSHTNRDVLKELAAACKKHGMRLGFYYSHWLDWQHPEGWDHNKKITGPLTDEQYNKYWQEKVLPQLRELLTNYGDISLLWFDMWVDYRSTIVKKEQLEQIIKLVKELQPNCLINSRLGLPLPNQGVDFESLGDNEFGAAYNTRPWETAGTIAHSWGYNALENQWKSTTQLLQSLIDNVTFNGNFTLNIGPRADGSVPYEGVRRLEDIGSWLNKNGETIYGSAGLPFKNSRFDWGRITTKKTPGNKQMVYLNVYNWPLDHKLHLSGILSKPEKISLIKNGEKENLLFTQSGPITTIRLPAAQSDPFIPVIAVEYTQPLKTDSLIVAESTFGGYMLNNRNFTVKPSGYKVDYFNGHLPDRMLINKEDIVTWKVYIEEPGSYSVDISCHNPASNDIAATVIANQQQLQINLKPDGLMIVEPGPGEITANEYTEHRAGTFSFTKSGYYDVSLKVNLKAGQELSLNRLWINKTE